MAKVMVLGGGFGGLAAAHELRSRLDSEHEILLVAADDRFFVGYAKLWDLVGTRPLAQGTARLGALDAKGIRFVNARITAIDPTRRAIETSAGPFDADYMIVALGAGRGRGKLGAADHGAFDLYDPDRLPAMRSELEHLDAGRVVIAVLGTPYVCPPAPYEAAFLVEEYLRRRGLRDRVEVVVATPMPSPLPMAGPDVDQLVASGLAGQGIDLRTGLQTAKIDTDAKSASFADGTTLDYALLLGIPSAVPPTVIADSPLAGEDGWVWPDPGTGRTVFDGVYAVGDCTAVESLPRAGVFAEALGRAAATSIAAEIDGGTTTPYDGAGYCFLEFNGRRAAALEGEFFNKPKPILRMAEPDTDTYARKEAFEAERLHTWLAWTHPA
ncbi:MAG: FAD/NAD(P)-binding oxidoreductase [Actinomycetota bacterium]|nr:FAD/NAD(P)-binding oxidoreductase [Actinomycetota bacterium]